MHGAHARHCERSEAIQGRKQDWIASSQELLAMTELTTPIRSYRQLKLEACVAGPLPFHVVISG
jgi:hypothetical protein